MRILVFNSGSSSIKITVFEAQGVKETGEPRAVYAAELSDIGQAQAQLSVEGSAEQNVSAPDLPAALKIIFALPLPAVDNIGYRVVHAGPNLRAHQRLTPEVLHELERISDLAPLHDPEVISIIKQAMAQWPAAGHFACFDTVFHQTMPEAASTYALPAAYAAQGVHRYGFHGLSCESIVRQMSKPLPGRMVIAHLGSGCSATAVVDGNSVDTTMGLTPTGGLVMGTRSGDLDPGVLLFLLRQQKPAATAIDAVEALLNHDSGLVALTGLPNDMQIIRKQAADKNACAVLGLEVFARSITKAIGGFCWLMGGLDAIVFTGGIGQHDPLTRQAVLHGLEGQGIVLDATLNQAKVTDLQALNAPTSTVKIYVAPSQENLIIAIHVAHLAQVVS